ncbi:ArnT family glycosyltransferase [Carboxydothermus hydrogenoformans]|uniref:Dolichyl-phosphate-mannose-protein mannosyltransferase n=1 Tax=Carboxydothermus hydrogenoformans (strain ATCC BAA-161 / DSM 6008 / Z-2901) TaxID=246194 RepID=Q3AD89_CARHZ|nr:glycosyltransferase family 39 protein [Carboxydothermus hydrogenoformans]ABB15215.1 dolichyl-phosphate-mannose-protein mannosyltransferase [Carboxydothermus hydrogenoformans Z-2901]
MKKKKTKTLANKESNVISFSISMVYEKVIIILIILAALIFRLYQINEPFIGLHDWSSADLARCAKSFFTFGFFNLKGIPVMNVVPPLDGHLQYYYDWPFLIYYLFAISFKIFGFGEWSVRIVEVLFSSGSVYLIYLIVKELWDSEVALISAFIFALIPLNVYYGRVGVFETPNVFFMLLMLYGYIRWIKEFKRKDYLIFLAGFLLGAFEAWQIYTVAFVVFLHALWLYLFKGKKSRKFLSLVFLFAIIVIVSGLMQLAYLYFALGMDAVKGLFAAGKTRTATDSMGITFTISQYLNEEFSRIFTRAGVFNFILALIGLVFIGLKQFKKEEKTNLDILIVFFLSGTIWLVVMKNHSFIHEYTLLHFMPFLSMAVALGVKELSKIFVTAFKNWKVGLAVILLLLAVVSVENIPKTFEIFNLDLYGNLRLTGLALKESTENNAVCITPQNHPGPPTIDYYAERVILYNKQDLANIPPNRPVYQFYIFEQGLVQEFKNYFAKNNPKIVYLQNGYVAGIVKIR